MTSPTGYINPVVVICPKGRSLSTTPLEDVQIYNMTTTGNDTIAINAPSVDFANNATHLACKMHVRGRSTSGVPKAQYTVSLTAGPDKGHFLDMPHGGKHWVFNAPGMDGVDQTLMRNTMAFHAQRAMGQWAPRTKFFELFLYEQAGAIETFNVTYAAAALNSVIANPELYYRGIYCNMEKIRKEKHRIDIPKYTPETADVGAIIMQLNPNDTLASGDTKYASMKGANTPLPLTADVELYEPENAYFTTVKEPKTGKKHTKADIAAILAAKAKQLPAIQKWYNDGNTGGWGGQFAPLLNNTSDKTDWDAIRASTDYTSFAIYFLLAEFAKDPDGYHRSTFMYKTADTADAKGACFAGPLWDKNKSFGNTHEYGSSTYTNPDGWSFTLQGGGQAPVWWHVLLKDPKFCETVWAQWATFTADKGILTAPVLIKFIDDQVNDLKATGALTRDLNKWSNTTFNADLDALKTYISKRLHWMNDNLKGLLNIR